MAVLRLTVSAIDTTTDQGVKETLLRVPLAEMPAKAAELVRGTRSADRERATIKTVRAALEINPSVAAIVVSAIAKAAPEMAALAASTAAELQPTQSATIAKAASAAAPSRAGQIVSKVCRVVPQEYYYVAVAVSEAVPGARCEVLEAVAVTFPTLKGNIDQALTARSTRPASVSAVLDSRRSSGLALVAAVPMTGAPEHGTTIAVPPLPISGTVTNADPERSGTVPRGGRNYAAP